MSDLVRKMSDAMWNARWSGTTEIDAIRAALLTLADNVTDEMVDSAFKAFLGMHHPDDDLVDTIKEDLRDAIAAAIREAAR